MNIGKSPVSTENGAKEIAFNYSRKSSDQIRIHISMDLKTSKGCQKRNVSYYFTVS
jgi:hypothetical protein